MDPVHLTGHPTERLARSPRDPRDPRCLEAPCRELPRAGVERLDEGAEVACGDVLGGRVELRAPGSPARQPPACAGGCGPVAPSYCARSPARALPLLLHDERD